MGKRNPGRKRSRGRRLSEFRSLEAQAHGEVERPRCLVAEAAERLAVRGTLPPVDSFDRLRREGIEAGKQREGAVRLDGRVDAASSAARAVEEVGERVTVEDVEHTTPEEHLELPVAELVAPVEGEIGAPQVLG